MRINCLPFIQLLRNIGKFKMCDYIFLFLNNNNCGNDIQKGIFAVFNVSFKSKVIKLESKIMLQLKIMPLIHTIISCKLYSKRLQRLRVCLTFISTRIEFVFKIYLGLYSSAHLCALMILKPIYKIFE